MRDLLHIAERLRYACSKRLGNAMWIVFGGQGLRHACFGREVDIHTGQILLSVHVGMSIELKEMYTLTADTSYP